MVSQWLDSIFEIKTTKGLILQLYVLKIGALGYLKCSSGKQC